MAAKPLPILLALLACLSGARADIILVDEAFTDGERSTSTLPGSLQWFSGAHNATAANAFTSLDAAAGNLLWDHTAPAGAGSFSGIWGHFAPAAAPVTLAVGEKLTLTFDLRFEGGAFTTATNAFRWALFDSNSARVTADFAGTNATGLSSGTTFSGWRGYAGQTTVATADVAGSHLLIRERIGAGTGLFTSSDYTTVAGTPAAEPLFALNTSYAGLLELERTAGGMSVRAGINGAFTGTGLDASPQVEFDTISFFVLDGTTSNLRMDNVRLVLVPEPATGLLMAAGLLVLRRARRRII